mgnify:CR=1 FL=1
MSLIKGYVEHIVYRNDANQYTVLELVSDGESYTLVGTFPAVSEGELIEAEGRFTSHPVYGEQLQVADYKVLPPEDTDSMMRYLGSGAIKGIGPSLAERIVKKFKRDTFRIIEEEPERLAEIKGISERMAMSISSQLEEKRDMRDAMMFLQDYGISNTLSVRIYQKYGPALYTVLRNNPYQLADDIEGIGFKLADDIARRAGFSADSDFRIKSGIIYALARAVSAGHTYLPMDELMPYACELLELDSLSDLEDHLLDLQIEGKVMVRDRAVYLSKYYYMELSAAAMLKELNIKGNVDSGEIEERLSLIRREENTEPDEKQIEAVKEAVNSGVLIITGGPGTGKTTTINMIIRYFEDEGRCIFCAAPTGRAAKRMSEATGHETKTIHRMLEYTGAPEGTGDTKLNFLRNEENPLEADVIIVDEASMVDIFLLNSLLKATAPGTRLIFVGDANQLPSVGAGNVLKDMIASGKFNTVSLTKIFRQAAKSDIVVNAHKINNGEPVDLTKRSLDFIFIGGREPSDIAESIKKLVTEKLPTYVNADPMDIQVLTPTKKGALGVEQLNLKLQDHMNPPAKDKREKKVGSYTFRTGDKVMQIKNDYDLEWEKRERHGICYERGTGIFNGDIGVITEINSFADTITVFFDDERYVEYDSKHFEELEPAYAVTVHKSQGSEYPAIVMPMYPGPHMLMNRNLLYTAVTRAKSCVCLVGLPRVFEEMEENENENKRYSGLKERILEVYGDNISEVLSDMRETDGEEGTFDT